MDAIIYKTEKGADNFQELLFQSIKHLVDSNTTKYSNVIKHPSNDLWAVQVDVNGFKWDVVSKVIGSRKIETLPEDWFTKQDLI